MVFIRVLLGLIIPFLILWIPTIYQIVFVSKRLNHKTKLSLGMIFLWALALGIICPPTAMFLSMASFEIGDNGNGEICITGIDLFIIMGAGIAFIFTPLIGIVGYVIEKITLKKYKSIRF